jgi:putative peptidoglycan lipid II flippase
MLSRLFGLVREQLFAALMGASIYADAFVVAFRIPNLLRDLFAEGALSQAFVPTFKASLKHDGPAHAYELANRVAGTLLVVMGLLLAAGALFAPQLVDLLAHDYERVPGMHSLIAELTRVMLPFLPIVSLAAVAMGMLNAQDRYAAPALAPAMFNVVSIAVGLALWSSGIGGRGAALGWSIGTVAGGLAQLGIQLPPLWRLGYRPRARADLRLRDPRLRQIGRLMLPAIIGVAAVQVNVLVNTAFATSEPGAAAWLNYAFRFLHLPIGVFGVAIATVSTTRFADSAADGDRAAMARQLEDSLRLTAFLCVPATVGLIALGEPIIALIYQHGRFGYYDTEATTAALDLYALGLVAYAAVKVIAPAFYAVHLPRVPMIASIVAVAGNVVISFALHPIFGYEILALGTAAAAMLNFAVLYVLFHRRITRFAHARFVIHLARIGLAAAVMGVAVLAAKRGMFALVGGPTLHERALVALLPVAGGALVYAAACRALRVEEVGLILSRLRRHRRG